MAEATIVEAIAALPPLRDVIKAQRLSGDKKLGQNFLLDRNITDRIARAGGSLEEGTVIEIGPGPGGLTRSLLSHGAQRLIAIEKDPRCIAALQGLVTAAPGRLTLIEADAMKIDPAAFGPAPRRIIANLPYNIATGLLVEWLQNIAPYTAMLLMFQREVAERIIAEPGGKTYGRLSVLAQSVAQCQILFILPPQAFTPAPKVASAMVEIIPRPVGEQPRDLKLISEITQAAFGQRRKMLRASLKSLGVDPVMLLNEAGIAETKRAEEVDIAGFQRLAIALKNYRSTHSIKD